jgi:hypothetical protein
MATTREVQKRGFAGRVFLYVFYGFNVLMVWWLVSYWGNVGPSLHTGSHAEQTGAAIGTTLGTGFIIFIWALGSFITGLLAVFTRGHRTYVEVDRDDFRASGSEQTISPNAFGGAADARRKDERRTQFGRGRPPVVASSSPGWSWSGVLFWAALVIIGLTFLGAIGQIVDPEGARARNEAREAKQQESAAQHQKEQMKEEPIRKEAASSFSNHLAVDSVRFSEGSDLTYAIVTVRVSAKLRSVKCAVIQGSHYLGVGSMVNASPPAEDVYVTIPGTGYGSGSLLRAECSSE